MSTSTVDVHADSIARGVLESAGDGRIVLALPHSDYRLQLIVSEPIRTEVGKRIKGTIHAKALRLFKAAGGGGGQFIEPLDGAPRIVAGRVVAVDAPGRRLLIDAAAPIWLELAADNKPAEFTPGDMVNGYVESGTRFSPA
jgi:hypothetical protein